MPLLQLNDAIFRDHARDRAFQHQAFDGLDIALHRLKLANRHRVSSLNRGVRAVLPLGMTGNAPADLAVQVLTTDNRQLTTP
jgi:hypothetical protein